MVAAGEMWAARTIGVLGRAVLVLAVVPLACSSDQSGPPGRAEALVTTEQRSTTTSSAAPVTSAVSDATIATTAQPAPPTRPPVPQGDPCGHALPPFHAQVLPAGIDPEPIAYGVWADAATPPGIDVVPELYDPTFVLLDPGNPDRRVEVFHGSTWRLWLVLRRELQVLGRVAWLSDLPERGVVIDFRVADSDDPCDYWALSGEGVSESDLETMAGSLTLDE